MDVVITNGNIFAKLYRMIMKNQLITQHLLASVNDHQMLKIVQL